MTETSETTTGTAPAYGESTTTDIRRVDIIAPNFKRRLSGVTSTIVQLVPVQRRLGQRIATLGPGLPPDLACIGFRDLVALWAPPDRENVRVWHARRNNEMLAGLVMRDFLRMPMKVIFTSASQRRHTGWTRRLIARMDAIIATSSKSAAFLEVANTVIPHGIDTERFSPPGSRQAARLALGLPKDVKIAGCFGRVRAQKGTDLFVDAMIRLLPSRPEWMAVITGRATEQHLAFEKDLKARIEAAGLHERIRFAGEVPYIPDWFKALDLFVAPQRWEGFGLTPLEAMATGVPVLATDVGAFSEIVAMGDHETGAIVAPGDVVALGDAAALFMDDSARAEAAGARGLQRARSHFNLEAEARAIGAVYQRVMNGKTPGSTTSGSGV